MQPITHATAQRQLMPDQITKITQLDRVQVLNASVNHNEQFSDNTSSHVAIATIN